MEVFLSMLGFVGGLLVLALAGVGTVALVAVVTDDERRQVHDTSRAVERRIEEIGRRAQWALLSEALRRAHRHPARHAAEERRSGFDWRGSDQP